MAMLNYYEDITAFLQANFTPSDPDKSNFKCTTRELLRFLFETFPKDCISDYELMDILVDLGYTRHTYAVDHITFEDNPDAEITTINKSLVNGWCLLSEINLKPDVFEVPKEKRRGR